MYLYDNIELQQLIMKELKKDSKNIHSILFLIHVESSIYKNDKELERDILKLLERYPLFQKSSYGFLSSGKIIVFSNSKKEEIEKVLKNFLAKAKKENIYKNISIGATIRKNKDTELDTLYQQVIRAIFHAETAGGWQYFFYSEEKENKFLESVKNFWEFNKELSDSQFISRLISDNKIKNLFERLDQFDNISGLLSYSSFIKKAQDHINNKNENKKLAVFYADIIGFKTLNKIYGEEEGNRFLRAFSDFIKANEFYISACRVYADNFIELFTIPEGVTLEQLSVKFIRDCNGFLQEEAHFHPKCNLGFICGMCAIDDRNESIYSYISKADDVRKSLKPSLSSKCGVFDDEKKSFYLTKQERLRTIMSALENKSFIFYLQPKINIFTNEIIGAEALVRMTSFDSNILPLMPGDFIPLMEETRDIVRLDFFIYKKVCDYINERKKKNLPLFPISVNVSREHFKNPHFVQQLDYIVKNTGIETKYLELEVTESVFSSNIADILNAIYDLKSLGYSIQMDDFGSGYSSLNLLKDIPFDLIKLDKEFLGRGEISKKNKILIKGIIALCKELDIPLLCEGVETKGQVNFLKQSGCSLVQGFYFAKPMPVEDFEKIYDSDDIEILKEV
ncbi:EAL domain-containing protein [Fusobacterium ulcerans]|uniref:EAL domain-containing protein n=1 Tax=Fusobacterium ulcerans TaxID=861 RepID=UPI000E52DB24|nr:EAL domain-containing protein [Fusobacterium ulcerans]RGY58610.1 EAL domain-containing protein [Fusobacterium ulcerans]